MERFSAMHPRHTPIGVIDPGQEQNLDAGGRLRAGSLPTVPEQQVRLNHNEAPLRDQVRRSGSSAPTPPCRFGEGGLPSLGPFALPGKLQQHLLGSRSGEIDDLLFQRAFPASDDGVDAGREVGQQNRATDDRIEHGVAVAIADCDLGVPTDSPGVHRSATFRSRANIATPHRAWRRPRRRTRRRRRTLRRRESFRPAWQPGALPAWVCSAQASRIARPNARGFWRWLCAPRPTRIARPMRRPLRSK